MTTSPQKGYIKLYRRLLDNQMWLSEPFTRSQAWIDMLLLANHKTGYIRKRGVKVIILRGQLGWSELALAERWRWSRGKVRRFLKELKKTQKIVHQKTNVTTLINIVNYDEYQGDGTPNGHQTDTKRYRNKNVKNGKKKEGGEFVPPNLKEITAYCKERKNNVNPYVFIDWYGSKGWMIGKNKMKDWKAAIRTWEAKDKDGDDRQNENKSGQRVIVNPPTNCEKCGKPFGKTLPTNGLCDDCYKPNPYRKGE